MRMKEKEILDIDFRIEIATQTLERNIGFISSCDNKASIILTAIGVLLTIILTNEGITKIYTLIKKCINTVSFCSIMYLTIFFTIILIFVLGIVFLIRVLVAKTDNKTASHCSNIFFEGINNYENVELYNKEFSNLDKVAILNEIISEIYINSIIAATKYKIYNIGLKLTVIGFCFFIIILQIGLIVF